MRHNSLQTNSTLLSSQSGLKFTSTNQDGQSVYLLNQAITPYLCPKVVKVVNKENIRSRDIFGSTGIGEPGDFSDDISALIMFRAMEQDEETRGVTFTAYKTSGVVLNEPLFEGKRDITRAEFVKILVRSLACRYTYEGVDSGFSDVDQNTWHADYITFATKHGWISGYSDGTFRPDAPISRQEAAKMLAKAIQLDTESYSGPSSFTDVPMSSEFSPYIESLWYNGILRGKTDTTFEPTTNIQRQEAARIVYRTFFGGE